VEERRQRLLSPPWVVRVASRATRLPAVPRGDQKPIDGGSRGEE
jgi:hypothetical protein